VSDSPGEETSVCGVGFGILRTECSCAQDQSAETGEYGLWSVMLRGQLGVRAWSRAIVAVLPENPERSGGPNNEPN